MKDKRSGNSEESKETDKENLIGKTIVVTGVIAIINVIAPDKIAGITEETDNKVNIKREETIGPNNMSKKTKDNYLSKAMQSVQRDLFLMYL